MKKTTLFLSFVIFALTTFAQVKYTSPLGNFKVTFKAAPEYQNSDVDIPDGTTKLHMFILTDENATVFMVACADYPNDYLSEESARNSFLQSAAEGFFGELNIVPGNKTEIKNGKFKGLEFSGLGTEYGTVYRVFIAKSTVFQVCVMSSGQYPDKAETKSFFKSFKITM